MALTEIAERMECGEPSTLCFIQTQSVEGSPHSIRWRAPGKRIKTKKIGVNPLYQRHQHSMNPYTHLIIALMDVNQGRRWNLPGEGR